MLLLTEVFVAAKFIISALQQYLPRPRMLFVMAYGGDDHYCIKESRRSRDGLCYMCILCVNLEGACSSGVYLRIGKQCEIRDHSGSMGFRKQPNNNCH